MTIDQTTTPARHTTLSADMISEAKRTLEEQRRDYHRILNELPPAHVDPVAAQQAHAARTAMAEIDAALHRIVEGTYGLCASCGQPIPEGRLEARPHTEHCVACLEASGR